MPMSRELDAAQRFIIVRHRELFDESPSPMKLQKLCYYGQGYLLAQGMSLFSEDFQAWQRGPVIPMLYNRYRDYGWKPITEDIPLEAEEVPVEMAAELVDIIAAYGRYDGAALSTMTHREAPWLEARGDLQESEGSSAVITKDALHRFFASKLNANGG